MPTCICSSFILCVNCKMCCRRCKSNFLRISTTSILKRGCCHCGFLLLLFFSLIFTNAASNELRDGFCFPWLLVISTNFLSRARYTHFQIQICICFNACNVDDERRRRWRWSSHLASLWHFVCVWRSFYSETAINIS